MFVQSDWLNQHLTDESIRILDCRFYLYDPSAGKKAYEENHIPGAQFIDIEKDLSSPVSTHGGRHPLPDPNKLANLLGHLGINEKHHIIVYDDQKGAMAGRCWWVLTYIGHPHVQILDGGYSDWKKQNYPINNQKPIYPHTSFIPKLQQDMLVDKAEVQQKRHTPNTLLIDSREPARYRGEEEPIDPVAGHIPGAINFPWFEVLNDDGKWRTVNELQQHFQKVDPDQEIIVYCGSGITATPNFIALQQAGYKKVKLYAGSWSDWITDPNAPIAKGEEPK
ncbi:thiosulfate/3-mercaptopyruvate sulfurtransferase [Seinonella peptonophila]|uniref:Thiosulfate/3-mercaptopyruvate sulfurtransferase n=1 Tax=Seinonella peptonophila TaxID=112248 RepID=A0A1M4WC26_9BACL|nr:sulfurtransferase [Seinonella peptonophila]SHE78776.1 thiosulfate/3-mercaptopyruvate sulfurtransferase [Seinonella peptonophila]